MMLITNQDVTPNPTLLMVNSPIKDQGLSPIIPLFTIQDLKPFSSRYESNP
jgi:hypothetical protein